MLTTADLRRFDKKLRELTDGAPLARPFLCEGLPKTGQLFQVGINPSKTTPFWPHWNLATGCDKRAWLRDYLAVHGKYSQTRNRIEILFDAIAPLQCIETNIIPHPSAREVNLATSLRDTRLFEFLLQTLRPRVVFVHGKSTTNHLARLTQTHLQKDGFTSVTYCDHIFDVLASAHLYNWSYAKVKELGKSLVERFYFHES